MEDTLARTVKKTPQGKECVADSSGEEGPAPGEEQSVMVWGPDQEEEPPLDQGPGRLGGVCQALHSTPRAPAQ